MNFEEINAQRSNNYNVLTEMSGVIERVKTPVDEAAAITLANRFIAISKGLGESIAATVADKELAKVTLDEVELNQLHDLIAIMEEEIIPKLEDSALIGKVQEAIAVVAIYESDGRNTIEQQDSSKNTISSADLHQ